MKTKAEKEQEKQPEVTLEQRVQTLEQRLEQVEHGLHNHDHNCDDRSGKPRFQIPPQPAEAEAQPTEAGISADDDRSEDPAP